MIRCIAIDDEPLALKQIEVYIKKVPFLELVALCHDAIEGIRVIEREHVDLMFVDINMPDLNGMDFVKSLSHRPYIIFTTAYSEYAVDGYKVEAVDYLLKPFSFNDLFAAVSKVKKRIDKEDEIQTSSDVDYIFIKCDYKTVRVNLSDIVYIEGMSEYVKVFVEGEDKPLMPLLSMKKIEETLPANVFVRVHKSFIVNVSKIKYISRMRITLAEDVIVPISEGYKTRLGQYISDKTLGL